MPVRLFLSYARNDDENFVARLHGALTAAGFSVWFDRVSMPSRSLTFHQEIRDAVTACDRLVLVVGPNAVSSDYVTQEWRFAYFEAVKCVNPIIRLDGVDAAGQKIDAYGLIPEDLRLVHSEDFRDEAQFDAHIANLIRQLNDPLPPAGKLVAVPELPPHYLDQPARIAALRDIVLADLQKPVVVSGAAARVGLQGMGGIGKSVLASALAHRPEVRRAFPDGVYWVTLGQEPNVAELQRGLARALRDDGLFTGADAGKEKLRELLTGRAVLLVLDDVWQRGHAEAFNVMGPRGRLLLTTRDAGLVTALAAKENHYQVQLPTEAEAEALLAKAAGVPIPELPAEARDIVDECGRLPLGLALCGGMVSGGRTWQDVLAALREHDLEYLSDSHPAEEQHRSIWKAMDVSVRALPENERERFAELAVFALDTGAPEAAVETLWGHTAGLSPLHARDLLMNFWQRSLIDFDQTTRRMTLHDLLHNFATGMAAKRFGSLVALHRRLLDAYRKACRDGWPSGPNDGYFLQSLVGHLLAAGETEDAVALLIGSSEWMKAQHAASGSSVAYTDDLALALETNPDPLTRISLHAAREAAPAQPRNYDDDDLRVLVSLGRQREAKNSVRSRVDPEQQCKGWIALYDTMRGSQTSLDLLELATQVAQRILTEYPRGTVMEEIAAVLARDGAIERARQAALAIGSAWHRASASKKVAASMAQGDPRVPQLLIEAAAAAREVASPSGRAGMLAEIAEEYVRIGDSRAEFLLDEAMKAATEENVAWKWSSAYTQVVGGWARLQRLDRILDAVARIKQRESVSDVYQCLVEIAKLLAAEKMPEVALLLKEWVAVASNSALQKHKALSEIALALTQAGDDRASQVFSEALEQANRVEFPHRAAALEEVGVNMHKAGDDRAAGTMLKGQMAIQNGGSGLLSFAEAYADIGEFDAAIDCAAKIPEYQLFSIAASRISTAATSHGEPRQALAVVERIARIRTSERTLDDISRLSHEFASIASELADDNDVTMALETTERVDMPLPRAGALGHIALALAKQGDPGATSMFTEALRELSKADTSDTAYYIKQMSKLLIEARDPRASEVFDQSFAVADRDRDKNKSVEARKNVVIALASTGLFSKALAVADDVPESTKQRAEALKAIAISLAEAGQFDKAISVARSIKDGISGGATVCNSDTQAEALCCVARSLRATGHEYAALNVLDSALSAAGTVPSVFSWQQAAILEDIATQLAQSGRADQAREVACRIPHQVRVSRALAVVAMEMDRIQNGRGATVRNEAVQLAEQMEDPGERTEALCDTALVIWKAGGEGAERLLERAYDVALAADEDKRAYRLGQFGKAMAECGNYERALEVAQRRETGWQRAEVLRGVFKVLRQAGDERADGVFQNLLAEVHQIDTYQGGRDRALKDVIIDLTELGDNERAIKLLGEMSIDSYSSYSTDAANLVARSIVRTGDFRRALSVLDLKEPRLSDFIGNMGTWAEAFELAEKGLSFKVLLAVCRVGGWVSPVWQRTHEILTGTGNGNEYQTARREWEDLPIWKRMFTKKPLPPSGI